MKKYFAVLLAALLSVVVMAADEPADGKANAAAAGEQRHELGQSLHELKFLEGNWNVDQQMKPSYSEKGREAHGNFRIERDLNGNALVGHFEADKSSDRGLKNFEGLMVISAGSGRHGKAHGDKAANAKADHKADGKHQVTLFWVDSEGNANLSQNVMVENNKLTATFDAHGNHPKSRVVFSKTNDEKLQFVMEHDTGKGWEQVATATYTRGDKATDVRHENVPAQQR